VNRRNNTSENNLTNIIERSPWRSLFVVCAFGCTISTFLWQLYFNAKIDNLKDRYEDKIEALKDSYEQKVEIAVIKTKQEEREKGNLNVDENSKLGKLLKETIKKIDKKDEK